MSIRKCHQRSRWVTLSAVGALFVAACAASPGVESTGAVRTPVDTLPAPESTTVPVPASDADGVGDTLFPALGNPGIDVVHYDLDLAYDTAKDSVAGTVTIDLLATDDLASFTLDAVDLDVQSVSVDSVPAKFELDSPELRIVPPTPLASGEQSTVAVTYSAHTGGRPSPIGFEVGWSETAVGSYVLNEPDGARYWLPCNDHPSDKATYRIALHVPAGVTAIANGALAEHTTNPAGDTWVWAEDEPMATYLLQVITGDYEVVSSNATDGLPLVSAVLRSDRARLDQYLAITSQQLDAFTEWFGPYPLDRYGLAITDSPAGFAMETQGRSMFSRDDLPASTPGYIEHLFLAHELAHQWFGDAVSPGRWTDVWLNESFATYAEWLWLDKAGLGSLQTAADNALKSRGPGATGAPVVSQLFGPNVYEGGAVVLHALRLTIGDDAFFRTLQLWVSRNHGQSRTTSDFIALVSSESGRDLTSFFDTWLYASVVPTAYP